MHDDPGRKLPRLLARGSPGARALLACVASLALHGAGAAVLDLAGLLSPLGRSAALPVTFVPLTPDQWAVNRAASGDSAPPREVPRRIVDLPPDLDSDPLRAPAPPPRDARHLAVRPQSVLAETVSRDAGAGRHEDLLRVAQRASEGVEGSGEEGRDTTSVQGRRGPRGAGGTPRDRSVAIALPAGEARAPVARGEPPDPEEPLDAPPFEAVVPLPGAEDGRRVRGERAAGLAARELPRPGGGPNLDGLGEVPEGDETRLDTHVLQSATFWIAVRERIEDEWQRRAVVKFRHVDPREDLYFWKPRTAVLKVALGARGELRQVQVVESSKLEFFDEVAVDAIRASTYPPPPPDAISADGEASIQVRITWVPSLRQSRLR